MKKIIAFAGSNSSQSVNRKLIEAAVDLVSDAESNGVQIEIIDFFEEQFTRWKSDQ